jgi:SAM-dependent methyltransferase
MNLSVNENSKVYYTGKYWNDYSECLSIINTRLFNEDIDWKEFLIKNNLNNFNHALILNCGNGWVERELYDAGIIRKDTAVEYNIDLVNECNKMKEMRDIKYVQHDINTVEFDENIFDLVINFAACHHIRDIEKVCINIKKWLKNDGYFINNDYIGPQRNQYSKDEWTKMNEINSFLPIKCKKKLRYPDVQQMMIDDPTEAINSCNIIPTIYKLFDIEYHKKSGGAIAYEILTHNNNLFNLNINERKIWVNKIMEYDEKYLNETGNSFFHFIICKNSKSIDKEIIDGLINNMDKREKLALNLFGHYCYNELYTNETIYTYDYSYGKSFFVHGFII